MLEHNIEDAESKENVLLINNKSLLSRDKASEINTYRNQIKNDILDRK
jgi:hypothetical protein